jgi:hypothetical protein
MNECFETRHDACSFPLRGNTPGRKAKRDVLRFPNLL